MKLLNIPLILTCIALTLGLIGGMYFLVDPKTLTFSILAFLVVFAVVYLYAKKHFKASCLFMFIAVIGFFILGASISNLHVLRNHHPDPSVFEEESTLQLKIEKILKPNSYTHNYIAEVIPGNRTKKPFKILFTEFHGDSLAAHLNIDDVVFTKQKVSLVDKPKIPHQFNYGEYLTRQHVYGKIIFNRNELKLVPSKTFSLTHFALGFKEKIRANLYESGFELKHIAFMEALVLGKKDLLSKGIYQDFANAGVLHVLAVSGLHVGFILLLLQFLFKPLSKNKVGRIISVACILVILWSYALLVGFTPSITRAVTMFSFLAFAKLSKRESSSLNLLFLSAVALLIYDPCFVYQIGFQLSYTAVFSIITLFPVLHRKLHFKYWLPQKAWSISCVTLTAQVGVFPISLYYFHQIPGLFLVSNLLLIPFIFILLTGCIVVIFWSFITEIPVFIKVIFETMIDLALNFVHFIAAQDQFIIEHIYFSKPMLIFSLLALIMLVFYLYQKKWVYLWLLSSCLFFTEMVYLYESFTLRKQERFYIFHENKRNSLALKSGKQLALISSDSLSLKKYEGLWTQENLKHIHIEKQMKNYYSIFEKSILIIDSTAVYKLKEVNAIDYLVLMNSPKINLERVVKTLTPKYIIADGSNYYSYLKRWEETAIKQKIPFHHTGKKGTFIIDN